LAIKRFGHRVFSCPDGPLTHFPCERSIFATFVQFPWAGTSRPRSSRNTPCFAHSRDFCMSQLLLSLPIDLRSRLLPSPQMQRECCPLVWREDKSCHLFFTFISTPPCFRQHQFSCWYGASSSQFPPSSAFLSELLFSLSDLSRACCRFLFGLSRTFERSLPLALLLIRFSFPPYRVPSTLPLLPGHDTITRLGSSFLQKAF